MLLDMPVLPHGGGVVSIRPAAVTGDHPAVSEVLGSPHRAGPALEAGPRGVADPLVVITARPHTGVVTVGVSLGGESSTPGPRSRWRIMTP